MVKTWDKVTNQRIAGLHPALQETAATFINRAEIDLGLRLRITQGMRTNAQQNAMYNQPHDGKDNDGDGRVDEADEKVTNAKGGDSWHNYGLAFDICGIDPNGKAIWELPWSRLRLIAVQLGLEWGGDWVNFKDKPHYQKRFGLTLAQAKQQPKNNGGFIQV